MSNWQEKIAAQNKLDTELLILNDKIGRASHPQINKVLSFKPVDDELLREYNKQFPTTYEYIDERTGEKKYRKFKIPSMKPELDKPDLIPTLDDRDFEKLENDKFDLIGRINFLENRLNNNIESIKNKTKQINNGNLGKKSGNAQISHHEKEINNIKKELNNLSGNLVAINIGYDRNLQDMKENQKRINMVESENKEKIQRYKKELEYLNAGAFNTEQLPTETDEEYYLRLKNNAEIEAPKEELEDAKQLIITNFKEKMKEILRDNVKIESICNTIDPFGKVDNKVQLLKRWPLFKEKFTKMFGVNNTYITADDVLEFMKTFINGPKPKIDSVEKKHVEPTLTSLEKKHVEPTLTSLKFGSEYGEDEEPISFMKGSPKDYDYDYGNDEDIIGTEEFESNPLPIGNPAISTDHKSFRIKGKDGTDLYFKCGTVSIGGETRYILLYSFNDLQDSFNQWMDKKNLPPNRNGITSMKQVTTITGLEPKDINKALNGNINSPYKIAEKLHNEYNIKPIAQGDLYDKTYKIKDKEKHEYGWGLSHETMPDYVKFGKVLILLPKLYYHNILSIKDHNKINIPGFKNVQVSDKLVKILMNLLENHKPSMHEINNLHTTEKQIYDRLIYLAGIHKSVSHTQDKTIHELKQRLKLIEGEIEAGNNSELLHKELYVILHALKDFKVLNNKDMKQYLQQFK